MTGVLTCNAGSTNIKLAVFDAQTLARGNHTITHSDDETWDWLHQQRDIGAIAHRVVHGGSEFTAPTRLTPEVIGRLEDLIPLAPLHQPIALKWITETMRLYPDIPHIACFDTAFHHTAPAIERRLPLPRQLHDEGIVRYGFHGLSYQHVAQTLATPGRVIAAHLGGGSSMCAMTDGNAVASTMGFSTLDGLMMSTRPGTLDPGVLLHLLEQKHMPLSDVTHMLYRECGLHGVSGISGDMRTLQESAHPHAKEAIDLYCRLAARQLAGLIPALGGLDVIVFTGGIGEHAAPVRQQICADLAWLGLRLDPNSNTANASCISTPDSAIAVYIIPADEELVLAKACQSI